MEIFTNKKIIIIIGVSLCISFFSIIVYFIFKGNFEDFKLVTTSPQIKNNIPTSTSSIVLKFNKEIDADKVSLKDITSTNNIVKSINTNGKTLTLNISSLTVDKKYEIKINKIVAKNNEEIIDLVFKFSAKYIPYNQLTEEERQQGVQDTDPEISTSSIRNFLPLVTPNYTLIGGKIYFSNGKSQDIVQVKDIFYMGINPPYPESEIKYSAESINNFLKDTGVDRNSYLLTSSNPTMAKYIGANPIPSDAKISPDNYTGDGNPSTN